MRLLSIRFTKIELKTLHLVGREMLEENLFWPYSVWPPSSKEGATAGAAQRHLGEGVGEYEAPVCQTVQVRSQHLGGTEVPAASQDANVRSEESKLLSQ